MGELFVEIEQVVITKTRFSSVVQRIEQDADSPANSSSCIPS